MSGGQHLLREMIDRGETVVAIGAHDALSALLVERAGFNSIYVGSFATESAYLGVPDLAMMSKTERLAIARNIVKSVGLPVIADMEEGFGNSVSVADSTRDFEAAGVAAVHIDDQRVPGMCPFLPGISSNQLIEVDEMMQKIRAACSAREDPEFMIIARSDVVITAGVERYHREALREEVVRRSNAYVKAGADAIFVMAFTTEELRYFREAIRAPLVGVFAPAEPIPIAEFAAAGFEMVIGSVVSLLTSAYGMAEGLRALRETGDWNAIGKMVMPVEELFEVLHLEKYRQALSDFVASPIEDNNQLPGSVTKSRLVGHS